MRVSKEFSFSEDDVRAWCEESGDHNPLHLDAQAAEEHALFGQRVVPGMMLLDRVSGLITQWAETQQGTPVLSRLSGVSFDQPVHFDQTVQISVEQEEQEDDAVILAFEVKNGEIAEPRASGHATVYLL